MNLPKLPEKISCREGKHVEGPTVVLLKQTHGDEAGGAKVVDLVMSRLKPITRGRLYYGEGNPRASEKNIRFIDSDLNRSYGKSQPRGYEGQRAAELKPILRSAYVLLDVHSFRKPAPPIICYPGNDFLRLEKLTTPLLIETVIYGPGLWPLNGDHLYTDTFVCAQGGIGLTIESGYLDDMSAVDSIAKGIQRIVENLLGARVHTVDETLDPAVKKYFHAYENVIAAKKFAFTKEWANFESVPDGTVYATAEGKTYRTDRDAVILFPKAKDSIVEGNEVCILLEKKMV